MRRFIQAIRENPMLAAIPILVVTTRNTKEDVITAIKSGANNYGMKPFGPTQLSEKIERVLQAI